MGYQKTAIKGFSWMGVLRGVYRAIALGRTAILARLLTPSQFGVFGIATLLLGLLEMFTETGINVFLIQEDEEKIETYVSTAWITSIIRGFIVAAFIFFLSGTIAGFFNNPLAAPIIQLIALVPLIRGFINPAIITFQKQLAFHKEFWFRSVLFFIDATVSIAVAFATKSPVSLAWGMIAAAIGEVILSLWLVHPKPTLAFDLKQWKLVMGRGKWMTLSGIFNYLFRQGPDIAIGKIMDTYALGLYQMTNRLTLSLSTEFVDVFNKVSFPIYVKIMGDQKRARRAYRKNSFVLAALITPISIVLLVFPKLIVQIVLGPLWLEIVPLLQISAAIVFVAGLAAPASAIFLAAKRQDYLSLFTSITLVSLLVSIVPLMHWYGIKGALLSLLFAHTVSLFVRIILVEKIFNSLPQPQ